MSRFMRIAAWLFGSHRKPSVIEYRLYPGMIMNIPDDVRRLVERSQRLLGIGYARHRSDGTWEHISAPEVVVSYQPPKQCRCLEDE